MYRRMSCLILLLCLITAGAGSAASEAKTVYFSDFSRDEDSWYGRWAQSFRTSEGTLRTEGREADWNSPGRDFALADGTKYELSVEVKQDEMASANFIISVAHTSDGVETYENLARGTAEKGKWTTLAGNFTAGGFDRYVFYVETTGAASLSYEIRNFTVTAPEGEPEAKPTESPIVIEALEDIPSLKEIYAGLFDFGTAAPQQVFSSMKLKQMILQQFSILTPENELKPDSVLDVKESRRLVETTGDETQVAVRIEAAKPLLNFVQQNGMKVHGHVLIWHSQTPEVLFHEGYDAARPLVSREVLLGRMENYIRGVLETTEVKYPDVIVSWDVLNEAIDDRTNTLRDSHWRNIIGNDYPNRAFEFARKYAAEGVKLYYNDYNTPVPGKLAGIVKLLNSLIKDGNIDGYGFQMHYSLSFPSISQIKAAVERIAKTGLSMRVSELDICTGGNTEGEFRKQAQMYASIMKLLIKHSEQLDAVQVWGLNDRMSWRSDDYPLLFDGKGNPKPAFWAVADPDSV